MAKRSSTKAAVMWGWTNHAGNIMVAHEDSRRWPANWFGGTRIRVRVTPIAKKAAKKRSGK